jgi:hypothetical protein
VAYGYAVNRGNGAIFHGLYTLLPTCLIYFS